MIDLNLLNAEQREAVLDSRDNLLILACAGSGKTMTVTYKIAYSIEQGLVRPGEVCAVTFTNRAAKEMRDRIAALLPDIDTTRMVVRTFHSLCASLLRRFGESVGLRRDFTIYDDDDSYQLLCSVSDREKKILREISRTISKVKDLGLTPDDRRCEEYSRYPYFRALFRAYESALERSGNVDFADLIGKAVELLRTDDNARAYCHNRFRLILVDEYQDSNSEQFRFLSLFASPSSQLVAVGDDDQSIYSFRGAEIRNILSFSHDFKNVREIKIEKNYRSTDEILALANALIKHNRNRHDKTIVSADGKKGMKPVLLISQSGAVEAKRIADIIKSTRNYNSTAVLYRTNAQSLLFETAFTKEGIPYKVIGALKFYDREEIKDALAFLRLLLNHRDEVSFRRIINKPARKIGDKKLEDILRRDEDLFLALSSYSADNPGASGEGVRVFLRAWKNAEERLQTDEGLGIILYKALDETELMSYYEAETDTAVRQSRLDNLSQLVSVLEGSGMEEDSIIDETSPESNGVNHGVEALTQFLERITLDTTVLGNEDPGNKDGVTLITMHNTKGLEYDTVFCAGLEESIIPGRNSEGDSLEEERRILYVAMTRARKRLYLSYAKSRMMWGRFDDAYPSPFLRDIPRSMIDGDNEYRFQSPVRSYYSNTPSWASGISMKKEEPKIKTDPRQLSFKEGDRVTSPEKGPGTVTDIEKKPDKTIITVLFDSGRTARYVAGHANIEKIG